MKSSLSRRALLQALTVGAGALAFGNGRPGEIVRPARAEPTATPKRLIIFPIANGVIDHADFGTPGASPTSFTLGPMLAPLEAAGLRNDLVCLGNLEMRRPIHLDTHFGGLVQLLTGTQPVSAAPEGDRSSHESLDQYAGPIVSRGLNWPSLYMGTMCNIRTYSYAKDGSGIPADSDPKNVYKNVFGSLMTGGPPDPAILRRLARRQSVLDHVSKDISSFVKRLPTEDRTRAEAQLTAVEDMERRLRGQAAGNTTCGKPMLPALDFMADDNVPATMRTIIDLTVAALACDQTRLVMFHAYVASSQQYFCSWSPVNQPGHGLHSLSHNLEGSPNFSAFKQAKAFHYQLAGELANKLKAIPEPTATGSSMLDHTVILLASEVGAGHTPAGLQFCTIGGKGLGVKTGQYLQYGSDPSPGRGMPHQRLLVSLLNAIGIGDTTFAEMDGTGSGPLPGYFA
jgi:hypothetical protein